MYHMLPAFLIAHLVSSSFLAYLKVKNVKSKEINFNIYEINEKIDKEIDISNLSLSVWYLQSVAEQRKLSFRRRNELF